MDVVLISLLHGKMAHLSFFLRVNTNRSFSIFQESQPDSCVIFSLCFSCYLISQSDASLRETEQGIQGKSAVSCFLTQINGSVRVLLKSSQVKLSFIVIPLHVWTYSGTKCRVSQDHGAT